MLTQAQLKYVYQAAIALVVGFGLTQLVGLVITTDAVSDADIDLFNNVVPELQSNEGLTNLMETLTKAGAIPLNRIMSIVIGLAAAFYHRKAILALIGPVAIFGSLLFQNTTDSIIGREAPIEHVIGASGGYYSGGVMRLVIIGGLLVTFFLPRLRSKWAYLIAFGFGVFEAVTRLWLGLHWPLDIVSALFVGLGIVFVVRRATSAWLPELRDRDTQVGRDLEEPVDAPDTVTV